MAEATARQKFESLLTEFEKNHPRSHSLTLENDVMIVKRKVLIPSELDDPPSMDDLLDSEEADALDLNVRVL